MNWFVSITYSVNMMMITAYIDFDISIEETSCLLAAICVSSGCPMCSCFHLFILTTNYYKLTTSLSHIFLLYV